MTSNVGQNYPYTSETEADRAARVASLVAEREGLADQLKADTTPLDANDRWWVYKCPSTGCAGLLHAAASTRSPAAASAGERRNGLCIGRNLRLGAAIETWSSAKITEEFLGSASSPARSHRECTSSRWAKRPP